VAIAAWGLATRADLASTLRWARSASYDELVAQRRRLTNAVFSGAYLEPIRYAIAGALAERAGPVLAPSGPWTFTRDGGAAKACIHVARV
jgi:hypothetical protein